MDISYSEDKGTSRFHSTVANTLCNENYKFLHFIEIIPLLMICFCVY